MKIVSISIRRGRLIQREGDVGAPKEGSHPAHCNPQPVTRNARPM